jgi:N utilization substance protein B
VSQSNRHRAREVALQILYRYDVDQQNKVITDDLVKHFEHFEIAASAREFAALLVVGTTRELDGIDQLIEKHATNWKVSRMALIDRNILRMATYEILNCADIPVAVTIDEAVELSKQFGTADTPAFINGILDSLKSEKR